MAQNEISVRCRALHRVQRLRHRLQAGARDSVGREPPARRDASTTACRARSRSRSPACTARTRRAWRCARSTASTRPTKASCCTTRTCASAAAIASTLVRSARRSFRRPARSACAARWTSARSARAARKPDNSRGRIQEIRPQPARRRQAAGVRGNVLDQGAAGRRWRRGRGYLPRPRHAPRQGRRSLGLGNGVQAAGVRRAAGRSGGSGRAGASTRARSPRPPEGQIVIGARTAWMALGAAAVALAVAGCGEQAAGDQLQAGQYQGKPDSRLMRRAVQRQSPAMGQRDRYAHPGAERVRAATGLIKWRHRLFALQACSSLVCLCVAANGQTPGMGPAQSPRRTRSTPTTDAATTAAADAAAQQPAALVRVRAGSPSSSRAFRGARRTC